MDKVCIGVPTYGNQPPEWWVPTMRKAAWLYQQDIELVDILQWGTMMTDKNRNVIVRKFLASEADWLYWIDADNTNPLGALRRLLNTAKSGNKTLVGGVYFLKQKENNPVAYLRLPNGRYETLPPYRQGEIVQVDASGMNGILCHRSVFEDIDENLMVFYIKTGGNVTVHIDDVEGDVFDDASDETDGKVIDGVLHTRVHLPDKDPPDVPFFTLENNRTEDFFFFEKAARVGHRLWLDTSVEAGHLKLEAVTGADYRENLREKAKGVSNGRSDGHGEIAVA